MSTRVLDIHHTMTHPLILCGMYIPRFFEMTNSTSVPDKLRLYMKLVLSMSRMFHLPNCFFFWGWPASNDLKVTTRWIQREWRWGWGGSTHPHIQELSQHLPGTGHQGRHTINCNVMTKVYDYTQGCRQGFGGLWKKKKIYLGLSTLILKTKPALKKITPTWISILLEFVHE